MKVSFVVACSIFVLTSMVSPICTAQDGGPKQLKIGTSTMVRNGSGIREKMYLSLYEGTLYLKEKNNDAKAIVSADETMAVRIEITSRFVSQKKMVTALNEGFVASTGGNTSSLSAEIQAFRDCFSDPIKMKDVFILAYVPGTGVVVYKNNAVKGTIAGLDFKKALFGIWLGDPAIDKNLRSAMLGKTIR